MRLIRLLKKDLAREITRWVEKEFISVNQAETICDDYGVDYHRQDESSMGYHVLVGLGFLFIGLAVITVIGANWVDIPRAVRMLGLIGLTLIVNLMGLYAYQQDKKASAVRWFFLGGLLYGASIMLIAQIYHIGEHYPDGIYWWAVGILPAAVLLESVLLMILTITLAFIWFFVESSLSFYPATFPLFIAALGWFLWKGRQSIILFIAFVCAIGFWVEYTVSWFLSYGPGFYVGSENVVAAGLLFLCFHVAGKWLEGQSNAKMVDYGTMLSVWVLRFTIFSLIILSFEASWRELIRTTWRVPGAIPLISVVISSCVLYWRYRIDGKVESTVVAVGLFLAALLLVMSGRGYSWMSQVLQWADNLVLISLGTWLIVKGIMKIVSHYFFAGVFSILVTALLRYFDLVGDYISAALLFIVFAFILLASAKYWKLHNKGIKSPNVH